MKKILTILLLLSVTEAFSQALIKDFMFLVEEQGRTEEVLLETLKMTKEEFVVNFIAMDFTEKQFINLEKSCNCMFAEGTLIPLINIKDKVSIFEYTFNYKLYGVSPYITCEYINNVIVNSYIYNYQKGTSIQNVLSDIKTHCHEAYIEIYKRAEQ